VAFRDVPAGAVLLAETTIRASTDVYCRERTPWRIGTVVLDFRAIVRHGLTVAREAKPRVCRPRKPCERNCAAAMSTAKQVRGTARHGVVPVCPPPKLSPATLVSATVDALRAGIEDAYDGDIAQDVRACLEVQLKALEREPGL
jgi:hypothetical protein